MKLSIVESAGKTVFQMDKFKKEHYYKFANNMLTKLVTVTI